MESRDELSQRNDWRITYEQVPSQSGGAMQKTVAYINGLASPRGAQGWPDEAVWTMWVGHYNRAWQFVAMKPKQTFDLL